MHLAAAASLALVASSQFLSVAADVVCPVAGAACTDSPATCAGYSLGYCVGGSWTVLPCGTGSRCSGDPGAITCRTLDTFFGNVCTDSSLTPSTSSGSGSSSSSSGSTSSSSSVADSEGFIPGTSCPQIGASCTSGALSTCWDEFNAMCDNGVWKLFSCGLGAVCNGERGFTYCQFADLDGLDKSTCRMAQGLQNVTFPWADGASNFGGISSGSDLGWDTSSDGGSSSSSGGSSSGSTGSGSGSVVGPAGPTTGGSYSAGGASGGGTKVSNAAGLVADGVIVAITAFGSFCALSA